MNLTGFYFLSIIDLLTMFNELNRILFFIEAYINRCSIAFQRLQGASPDYTNSILKTNSEIHNRSTRFANIKFHCPVSKKNTEGGRTFSVRSIRNWNELSIDVKKVKNAKSFKKKLYTNLISKQRETYNFEYLLLINSFKWF